MNSTGVVVSSIAYFTTLAMILTMLGVVQAAPQLFTSFGEGSDAAEPIDNGNFFGNVFSCIGETFLLGFQGFNGCDAAGRQLVDGFEGFTEFLSVLANTVVAIAYFFFQFFSFQLPLPFWAQSIIMFPPLAGLGYVGFRLLRGGG